jgi:hypothetical protein
LLTSYFDAMLPAKNACSWTFPFTHWNWKVAATTAVFRGAACIVALRHADIHARQHFGAVEAAYVLLTAGFFSALQQQSLEIKSRKLAWLAAVIVVPFTSLGVDSLLHIWLNRVNAHALGIGAAIFTLVSAMFHWHVMRNGAMLVGESSNSLVDDLKRMPKLLLSFAMSPMASFFGRSTPQTEGLAGKTELEMAA